MYRGPGLTGTDAGAGSGTSLHGRMCILAKVAQNVGLSDVVIGVLEEAPRATVGKFARVDHAAMMTQLLGRVEVLVTAEALVRPVMTQKR